MKTSLTGRGVALIVGTVLGLNVCWEITSREQWGTARALGKQRAG